MSNSPRYVIVIGASAGGLNALTELVGQFHPDMDAAVFIVLHLSRKGISDFLVLKLERSASYPCVIAEDGMPIEKGHIYIAAPNKHLLIKKDVIKIGHGPEENRWRPSIDVLFRSAAAAYSTRTIGIILTGLLDDGTSGMWAIKRSGGTCIVQDPHEAEYPDMPLSVLNSMECDYCIPLADMGPVILAKVNSVPKEEKEAPPDVIAEAEIAERTAIGIEYVASLGDKSIYSCPDCGGGLYNVISGNINRYRCHIGHSYSERDLAIKQAEALESTLWLALRMMEERKKLLYKLENDSRKIGLLRMADVQKEKAEEIDVHINVLREVLYATQNADQT